MQGSYSNIIFPLAVKFFNVSNFLSIFLEGYNTLRRKFGPDSFLVNGPYSAIMSAFTPPDGAGWAFNIPGKFCLVLEDRPAVNRVTR